MKPPVKPGKTSPREKGPPPDPLPERHYVQIQCDSEADQRALYEQFRRAGRRVRVITV